MKRILAIRFARLGDVILLLPALSAIKSSMPEAKLTVLTGHRCAPIAEMCPSIDDVLSVDRVAMRDGPPWRALHDMKQLVWDIRSREFDAVIDFHSFRETNLLTWFSRAPFRMGMRRHDAAYLGFCFNRPPVDEDKSLHVSEMFVRVAQSFASFSSVPNLSLRVPEDAMRWVGERLPAGPRIVFYVDAPVDDRRWPAERFAAAADDSADRWGAHPVIVTGGSGKPLADLVLGASRAQSRLTAFSDLSLQQLAAAISSAGLLVSNDTGPMHLGPALGVPTLGLFSVGLPEHFKPIGPHNRFLRRSRIEDIAVEDVIREIDRMWTKDGRDLRR